MGSNAGTKAFIAARELLLRHRDDYEAAYRAFRWPKLDQFNWALDWFDAYASGNKQIGLHVVSELGETKLSFDELSDRSSRVARAIASHGITRGDCVLIMLGNTPALWEAVLACQKLGAVVVPTATQATASDLQDRIERGRIRMVITTQDHAASFEKLPRARTLKFLIDGGRRNGWTAFDDARADDRWKPQGVTHADDPFLLYFTSGTTAKPKLVLHTHESYPVGHLSTMYWIGIREGSTHQNISSPGWAKHAWSSVYAPWNAGATVVAHEYARFNPAEALQVIRAQGVNSLCAPPTVWRMLILQDIGAKPAALTELVSAGEPLNPEIIDHVASSWGLKIRDGYGQTETTAQIGNSPGAPIKLGSMGRPLPGYKIALLDHLGNEAAEGEVAVRTGDDRPTALMQAYLDDKERTAAVMSGNYYRTGDEASVDGDGYFHFVGRADDVFKSSDYRISPFELESALLEYEAVAESAVIPSPDPLRLNVPKAVITLKPGFDAKPELARDIFAFAKKRLAPYKQIRRLHFAALPKTISGKIRRAQLRDEEKARRAAMKRAPLEFWAEDFKD